MRLVAIAPPEVRAAPAARAPATDLDAEGALRRILTLTDLAATTLAWGLAGPIVPAGPTSPVVAGRYHSPIVLIGRSPEVATLATFYPEHPEVGYSVQGVLGDEPLAPAGDERWLGSYRDDVALEAATEVGTAVLAMGGLPSVETNRLLRHLRGRSVRVHLHTGLTQISLRRLRALPLAHEVRPGMTGLWQVEARDKPSIYAYRRLDLFYVDNWTIVGDLGILVRTAGSLVTRGARRALRATRG